MAGTLVKRVMLKITADDGDTEAKLGKIHAEAQRLGEMHPELKVRLDSAEATAKMAVLRKDLRDTAKAAGSANNGFKFSNLVPAIGGMSMFQKVMLGVNVATTFAEPLLAGVVVAAGGLAAGLASAGLGLGIFGAAAKGAFAEVQKADKANKTLTGGLGRMQSGLKDATREWQGFVRSASPGVASVIAQGLGLIPKALSLMKPFLAPVEHALHGIITDLSHGLNSPGFKSFMDTMAKNTGPMITGLAHAIGHIVVGIGGILKAFMPMSHGLVHGLDDITAKFAKWGSTLSGHSGFKSLMATFRTETPLAVKVLKNLGSSIATIVKDMTGLSGVGNSKTLLQIASPFTALLSVLLKANPALVRVGLYLLAGAAGASKLKTAFSGLQSGWQAVMKLGTMIEGLGVKLGITKAATEGETVAQTELDGAMDANPIGLIVIAVAALAFGIVELWKHSAGFRNFWKGLWKEIKHLVSDAVDFIRAHWKLLPAIFLGPLGIVVSLVLTHWQQISSFTARMVGDVVRFFRSIPGRIRHLISDLFSIGSQIIMGLVHGIESAFGAVEAVVGRLVNMIPSGIRHFFDMASPSKLMMRHGKNIGLGLAMGIDSSHSSIEAAAARMAKAAGLSPGGRYGPGAAAAGGGQVRVEFDFRGADEAMARALRQMIRVKGGNVQLVLGH
jgi:phage-related protein